MKQFDVRLVGEPDRNDWFSLFAGYAEFYGAVIDEGITNEVWGWLTDPSHVMEGFIARDAAGVAVGMANVRACPRSLSGTEIGFLDDIFVHPDARGSGAADALFAALKVHARDRDWAAIRWITQHFNQRGRAFYDRYTDGPSEFIMYQWTP